MSMMGDAVGRISGFNLLAPAGTLIELMPQEAQLDPGELSLLPQFVYAVMRARTGGALSVSPKFRIGANATHDDVCPIFTVPLATPLNVFAQLPLVAFPLVPVNLRAGPVFLEITQAGVGPASCTGDILLVGFKASP
jgi:hypothetical protein